MILAPVLPVPTRVVATPVTIRLIGTLDRVLIGNFTEAFEGLTTAGSRTFIVMVRDLVVLRDECLDRFLATLDAYVLAGHRVIVDATPSWRKAVRGRSVAFEQGAPHDDVRSRRQLIICHSLDKRTAGAA